MNGTTRYERSVAHACDWVRRAYVWDHRQEEAGDQPHLAGIYRGLARRARQQALACYARAARYSRNLPIDDQGTGSGGAPTRQKVSFLTGGHRAKASAAGGSTTGS